MARVMAVLQTGWLTDQESHDPESHRFTIQGQTTPRLKMTTPRRPSNLREPAFPPPDPAKYSNPLDEAFEELYGFPGGFSPRFTVSHILA
ncbi:MAG TPA: hypothetical protein VF768_01275 [Holophagaceae bacterium]